MWGHILLKWQQRLQNFLASEMFNQKSTCESHVQQYNVLPSASPALPLPSYVYYTQAGPFSSSTSFLTSQKYCDNCNYHKATLSNI
jgi:hypothetical protein